MRAGIVEVLYCYLSSMPFSTPHKCAQFVAQIWTERTQHSLEEDLAHFIGIELPQDEHLMEALFNLCAAKAVATV